MFVDHMRHFLSRVRDPALAPRCSFDDSVACLKILLAARRSAASNCWVPI
jgi:hypothetical protein